MRKGTSIEQQVMASVAVVYAARKLTSLQAVSYYVLALSALGIAFFVSVPHVVENFTSAAHGGVPNIIAFVGAAITNTTVLVQASVLAAIFALGMIAVNFVKSTTTSRNNFA